MPALQFWGVKIYPVLITFYSLGRNPLANNGFLMLTPNARSFGVIRIRISSLNVLSEFNSPLFTRTKHWYKIQSGGVILNMFLGGKSYTVESYGRHSIVGIYKGNDASYRGDCVFNFPRPIYNGSRMRVDPAIQNLNIAYFTTPRMGGFGIY